MKPAAQLAILVDARTGPAVRGLVRVNQQLGATESRAHKTSAALKAIGKAGAALGAAGLAVGVKKAFDEFREAEKVTRQTEAVLKSTGGQAKVTAKEIEALAASISRKAGIDDEAIQKGENLLLTFTKIRNETGKGNQIFTRATKTIVDMSVSLDQDLKSSAIQVGKALNDPVKGLTALQRVGVAFTEKQKERVELWVKEGKRLKAQRFILKELKTEFGGSAKAQADWVDKLKVAWDNLFEAVGRVIGPKIQAGAQWLTRFINQMQTGRGTGGRVVDTVKSIASAVEDVWNFGKKIPPELYALLGIAVAGVKVTRGANRALGGTTNSLLGRAAGKAAPVPVFVTNPGFAGPGKGPGGGTKVPPIVTRAIPTGARWVPLISAGTIIAYVARTQNRDLPTGSGSGQGTRARPVEDSARGRPGLVAPHDAFRRVTDESTAMGTAFKRAAELSKGLNERFRRGRELAPALGNAFEVLGGKAKGAGDKNRNLAGGIEKVKDRGREAQPRIGALGTTLEQVGNKGRGADRDLESLAAQIRGLKGKKIDLSVTLDFATEAFDLGMGGGRAIHPDMVQDAIRKKGSAWASENWSKLMGAFGGGAGGGALGPIASRFGLGLTSGLRPGDSDSWHGVGRAWDYAGPPAAMLAFAKFLAGAFGGRLLELIHTPLGFSIDNGRRVPPFAQADHYDHVHVAMQRGGMVPGQGVGDKVPALLEPREFVMNSRATRAFGPLLEAMNSGVARLKSGGWARTPINIAADAYRKAGFRGRALNRIISISGRETGGTWNPKARGGPNNNGTFDHGLSQVNDIWARDPVISKLWSRRYDPYVNAEMAYRILRVQGWSAWASTINDASQYNDQARAALLATRGGAARKAGRGNRRPVMKPGTFYRQPTGAHGRLVRGDRSGRERFRPRGRRGERFVPKFPGAEKILDQFRLPLALAALTESAADDLALYQQQEKLLAEALPAAVGRGQRDKALGLAEALASTRDAIESLTESTNSNTDATDSNTARLEAENQLLRNRLLKEGISERQLAEFTRTEARNANRRLAGTGGGLW